VKAIAAIDLGRTWVGIAVTGADGLGAYPVTTLKRRSIATDLEAISALFVQYEVGRVVVGLPLNMDGTSGPQAVAAETFARRLRERVGLEVELFDERLTSFEAEERLKMVPSRKKRQQHTIDAVAACVILESWQQARVHIGR
jgi:putative holliday junction resolvase